MALERLRVFANSTNAGHRAIFGSRSSRQGTSLADLTRLAAEVGMNYQPAFRTPGSVLVTPCVMHLRRDYVHRRCRNGKSITPQEHPFRF